MFQEPFVTCKWAHSQLWELKMKDQIWVKIEKMRKKGYCYMAPFENYDKIMVVIIAYMNIEEFNLKIRYLQFMFYILNIRKWVMM
jgi:hypothetical protein